MNIEDIKIGETYYVRAKVWGIRDDTCIIGTIDGIPNSGYQYARLEPQDIYPIPCEYQPLNLPTMTEIPETYPKYDPCREFREGDEVRYVPCNGRECPAMPCDEYYREKTLTVVEDEDSNHQVRVRTQDGREKYIRFCYLQLITPVEELEPYFIEKGGNGYRLMKRNGKLLANYWETHPHTKAAAEAERDRLNAEYRKEKNND